MRRLAGKEEKNEEKRGKSDFALKKERFNSQEYLAELARNNKVLFVLYEISRHLNQIHDFNELLSKIMDLIFMVIDAVRKPLHARGVKEVEVSWTQQVINGPAAKKGLLLVVESEFRRVECRQSI